MALTYYLHVYFILEGAPKNWHFIHKKGIMCVGGRRPQKWISKRVGGGPRWLIFSLLQTILILI